jgi:hypothetical protein
MGSVTFMTRAALGFRGRFLTSEAQPPGVITEQCHTKEEMAARRQTSRAQIDRLLDPKNSSATLETLVRAAKVVCRRLRLELV